MNGSYQDISFSVLIPMFKIERSFLKREREMFKNGAVCLQGELREGFGEIFLVV